MQKQNAPMRFDPERIVKNKQFNRRLVQLMKDLFAWEPYI